MDMIHHPELRLVLAYARQASRPALAFLFALDERLSGFVGRASEPTMGLIRLVWWRDTLAALGERAPPGEPLLVAAAASSLPPAELAAMVEGWAVLLDDPEVTSATMATHAVERGGRLFRLAGQATGLDDSRLTAAGEGWAMVDRARHASDVAQAAAWLDAAKAPLADTGGRWPRALRPLGMLAALAREDVARGAVDLRPPASRGRLARILAHQLTGR
jgi:phytoene synthase